MNLKSCQIIPHFKTVATFNTLHKPKLIVSLSYKFSCSSRQLIYLFIYLFTIIYGIQKRKRKDEIQKSQRPHIEADN